MSKPASTIYREDISDLNTRLTQAIERGCDKSPNPPLVFFRADDIGYPSRQFYLMIAAFKTYEIPLCLATVPSWLTRDRFAELSKMTGFSDTLWCWHQHGCLHRNFEVTGKKQEFGSARDYSTIHASLAKGQQRLASICNGLWHPVFTPPWNRCSRETLDALENLGFKALSRSTGASPESATVADFQVNVDLHTRKETSPTEGLTNLLKEIETGLGSGLCGIMLHHQRMNRRSYIFLDILLDAFKNYKELHLVHFGDLIKQL